MQCHRAPYTESNVYNDWENDLIDKKRRVAELMSTVRKSHPHEIKLIWFFYPVLCWTSKCQSDIAFAWTFQIFPAIRQLAIRFSGCAAKCILYLISPAIVQNDCERWRQRLQWRSRFEMDRIRNEAFETAGCRNHQLPSTGPFARQVLCALETPVFYTCKSMPPVHVRCSVASALTQFIDRRVQFFPPFLRMANSDCKEEDIFLSASDTFYRAVADWRCN